MAVEARPLDTPIRRAPTLLSTRWVVGVPIVVAVGAVTLLPVLFLFVSSFNVAAPGQEARWALDNWQIAFGDSRIINAIWNTVTLAITRVVIAVMVGILFAWLIARTDLPGGSTLEFLFWVAFFVPALPLTLGWVLLLDARTGLINTLLLRLPFVQGAPFDIYSFWGIIWVHLTATSIPIAVMLFTPAFRQLSAALEESARMCGANALTTLRRVTVPILVPTILPATIIMLIRSLEAFEIELLLGSPVGIFVYSTRIYDLLRESPPQYGAATALGTLFLVVLFALAGLYLWYIRGRRFTTLSGQGFSKQRVRLGRWRWAAFGVCALYLLLSFGLSLGFLTLGSLMRRFGFFNLPSPYTTRHWELLLADPILLSSLGNSLVLGISTAVIGVAIFSLLAYITIRSQLPGRRSVELMAWLPWAVPGVLLGLSLVWLYLETPLRTILYGTLSGLVLAMLIKELPVGMQLLKAGFTQLGNDLEEAGRVCGASWSTTYWKILVPLLAPVAINVAILAFQGAVRDIGMVVLLYNNSSRPLSILMLEYSFGGQLERGAAVGLLLVVIVSTVAFVARRFGFRAGHAG